jgi:uncharacterized protein involved in exopolysaccharide biosynthesis
LPVNESHQGKAKMNTHVTQFSKGEEPSPANPGLPLAQIMLAVVARRWSILAIVFAATLVGLAVGLMMPPIYSATAVVQVGLAEREAPVSAEPGNTPGPLPIELLDREIQEARLLQSESLAHQVAIRLGMDQAKPASLVGSAMSAVAEYLPQRFAKIDLADVAARGVLSNLVVRNEPRSNLIAVTYTDSSPDEAARIANAVVGEHIHARRTQILAARVATARSLVTDLSATYGAKHHLMGRASDALVQAESALEKIKKAPPPTVAELAATGFIVPARAETTPTGLPLSSVVGLAAVAGLVMALLYVLISEFFREEVLLLVSHLPNWLAKGRHSLAMAKSKLEQTKP